MIIAAVPVAALQYAALLILVRSYITPYRFVRVFAEEPPLLELRLVHRHGFLSIVLEVGDIAVGREPASARLLGGIRKLRCPRLRLGLRMRFWLWLRLWLRCRLGLGPMFRNRATVFTLRLRRTRISMQIVIDYRSYCYEKTNRYHNGLWVTGYGLWVMG